MTAFVGTGKLSAQCRMHCRVVGVRQAERPHERIAGKAAQILSCPGHFPLIGHPGRLFDQGFAPRRFVIVVPCLGGRDAPFQPQHFEPPVFPVIPDDAEHARIGQPSGGGAEVACHLLQRLLRHRQLKRRIGRRPRDVRVVAQEGADLAGRIGLQAQRGRHQHGFIGVHPLREHGPAGKAPVPVRDGHAPAPHAPVGQLVSEKPAWWPGLMPLEIRGRRQCQRGVVVAGELLEDGDVVRIPPCLDAVLRDALAGLLAASPGAIALPAVFGDIGKRQFGAGHGRQFVEVAMQEGLDVNPAGRERRPAVDQALGDQQHGTVLEGLDECDARC